MAKRKERRRAAFGPVLVHYRERAELTQRELAELSGVLNGHIAAIEAGYIRWPKPGVLGALAFALDIPVALLELEQEGAA